MSIQTATKIPDPELVTMIRKGDQSGMGLLYDRFAPSLLDLILKITGNMEQSETILKTVFISAWHQLQAAEAPPVSLAGMLFNLGRRTALEATDKKIMADQIRSALTDVGNPESMKSKESIVMDLIYYKGMSCTEVASLLNMEPDRVRMTFRNAINHLNGVTKQ